MRALGANVPACGPSEMNPRHYRQGIRRHDCYRALQWINGLRPSIGASIVFTAPSVPEGFTNDAPTTCGRPPQIIRTSMFLKPLIFTAPSKTRLQHVGEFQLPRERLQPQGRVVQNVIRCHVATLLDTPILLIESRMKRIGLPGLIHSFTPVQHTGLCGG